MSRSRLFTVYFALDFSARSRPTSQRKRPDALWLAELVVDNAKLRRNIGCSPISPSILRAFSSPVYRTISGLYNPNMDATAYHPNH